MTRLDPNLPARKEQLRVAFLAGTLAQGGAEKQMAYMAEALCKYGAAVEVFTLTRGGFFDEWLQNRGVLPQWVGRFSNPALRVASLARAVKRFRPQFLQAGHTYMSAYAAMLSRIGHGIGIGAVRTNLANLRNLHNRLTIRLLMSTPALITNSEQTRSGLLASRLACADCIHVIPNAIDICEWSRIVNRQPKNANESVTALFLGRLIPSKRVDRFVHAIALARREARQLIGIVAGDGPERCNAELLARGLGLSDRELIFVGHAENSKQVLANADLLVFTSDDKEGSPNSILESMAAGLPVITTPCGNAPSLIEPGVTGFVSEFNEISIAEKMKLLARSPELRREMGEAGLRRATQYYGTNQLAPRLIAVYRAIASTRTDMELKRVLEIS
jgi:glycosyltransferase involved in cell wall biosynthesis